MFKLPLKLGLLLLAAIAAGVLWQKAELSVLALARLDPVPETRALVEAGHYAEAAEYLGFFMEYDYVSQDPAARALHDDIQRVRSSAAYRARKVREGLFQGTSDETIGQATGIAADLLVIGDLRDLSREGINWSQDREVDEVIVALSGIGLAASAAQLATAGAATPIKGGVIALKIARKGDRLPPWLGKAMIDGAATVKRTGKLDAVSQPLGDVHTLARVPGGLNLLSHTEDIASLKRMARLAKTFGKETATLYRIGGDVALKTGARAGELGVETVKLAATYGRSGLKTLDRVGATTFVKYAARSTKVAYKGDIFQLIARFLAQLPDWLLVLFTVTGAAVWVPRRWIGRPSNRLSLASNRQD
ncbi:hypothetical protein [Thiobaca trueperi]|uniref:Uncharacterized protein n=1 Tax=Thiobaca trueperi TaxID=127458 RepID=A0A4R3MVS5_9GAMM|nr:hypothetical protein [Thiobaca trueperi]TCT19511.1 hypothetical protein EDC35_108118 [Thiobaca trueperi]